jgi:hypothetical protein
MKRLAFLLALTGCGSNPPPATPAPAQPDCNAAVATTARFLAAHGAPAEETERIKATVALHCVEDHWTAAATSCVGRAKDMEAAHACLRETLTVAQHENIMGALQGATPAAAHHDQPPEPVAADGSQAAIAAKLNDEGKDLMFKSDFAAASTKFRDAVARVPDPKYFFNLCVSLFSEGKYSEALASCQGALVNQPDAALRGKIEKTIVLVKNEAKKQGVKVKD